MWTVTSDRSTIWSSLNDDMMISFLFMWNGKSFNDNAFSYTHHFTINLCGMAKVSMIMRFHIPTILQ